MVGHLITSGSFRESILLLTSHLQTSSLMEGETGDLEAKNPSFPNSLRCFKGCFKMRSMVTCLQPLFLFRSASRGNFYWRMLLNRMCGDHCRHYPRTTTNNNIHVTCHRERGRFPCAQCKIRTWKPGTRGFPSCRGFLRQPI